MAVSSNRSPLPITSKPNANSRTPEVNNPIRRSFNGNPFTNKPSIVSNPRSFNPMTPANSPSDFGRRNSIDKSVLSSRDYEQKENEKDNNLKPVRVRSPSVSKGAKNFMSPTISAASKITSASPRKKVLAERNEPLQTSVSFSDAKSPFASMNHSDVAEDTDSKSEKGSNQKKIEASFEPISADSEHKEASLRDTSIPKASKSDVVLNYKVPSNSHDSESESALTVEPDCVNGDASFKISPGPSCFSCPILAPLDIDPSLPPYDPQKNYLSPRPQFLHYKPNPRIEVYLNKERGFDSGKGKCLEDSFILESSSDTENTEETRSEDSQKESEDTSSFEMLKEQEEEEPHDSEPKLTITHSNTHLSKETVEAKPHFLARSKSISLLLIFIIACLSISVTDTPLIGPTIFKDQSFSKLYDPSEFVEFAKANFAELARNFRNWSANSISYFSKLFPTVRDLDQLGPLHFTNFTALRDDLLVDGCFTVDNSIKGPEKSYQQNELGPIGEGEVEIESLEEKGHLEIGADDKIEEASGAHDYPEVEEQVLFEMEADNIEEASEDCRDPEFEEQLHPTPKTEVMEQVLFEMEADNIEEASEDCREPEFEEQLYPTPKTEVMEVDNSEVEKIQRDTAFHMEIEPQCIIEFKDQSEMQPKVPEAREFQGENGPNSLAKAETIKAEVDPENSEWDVSYGNSESLETLNFPLNGSEDEFLGWNMLGLYLLVPTLITVAVFTCGKRGKTSKPKAVIPVDQLPTKKLISAPVTAEHTYQERRSSINWPTEVDMVGESCPSEMSSFQKSSSYRKRGNNEVQSHERKPRKNCKRESLASSSEYSMGSPSYGSFTTYEIIHSKHEKEETVTPVRRSSRIKNQVTSP